MILGFWDSSGPIYDLKKIRRQTMSFKSIKYDYYCYYYYFIFENKKLEYLM